MYNVIADIAGQYKALQALLEKMPRNAEPISIGDMVDRGPMSKEVVEFFMANGRAIMGNHEHLMLNAGPGCSYYPEGLWFYNGGGNTFKSFGGGGGVPDKILKWVSTLPKYLELEGCLISHAFLSPVHKTIREACDFGTDTMDPKCEESIIWNRSEPIRRAEYNLQIAGHNSHFGLRRFSDDQGDFGLCIDDSKHKVLTGINLPSMEVYQQKYID